MRIIAGRFRGRALASVGKGDVGAHLRPTSDRVRESLFSVLTSLDALEGARVMDLFAGTGALGLEALSRGASHVTLVENGRVGSGLVRQNVTKLGCVDETRLITRDATRLPPCQDGPCGLLFLDPPYGKDMGHKALDAAQSGGWIAPDALIVWEENAPMPAPSGFTLIDSRKYGDTYITLLRATGDQP